MGKTIEETRKEITALEDTLRNATWDFITSNPGVLPNVSIQVVTEETAPGNRRVMSVTADVSAIILPE